MTAWHGEEQKCKKQNGELMIVATCYILVVRAAVSVLVMVVMMVRSGVVVFLIQWWGVGGAKAFSLFLGLLENTAVGQSAEPAQQLPINLCSRQKALLPDWLPSIIDGEKRLLVPRILTFLLPSSFRSKAHCCLHCSHVCGGPYFFSELVQRWHFVPINAAIILQYWHGLGCKMDRRTAQSVTTISVNENSKLKYLKEFYLLFQTVWHSEHTSCR